MIKNYFCRGYLMLQCMVAIFCVSIALLILIKLNLNTMRLQHSARWQAMALINAASARHIQQHYSIPQVIAWQEHGRTMLPNSRSDIEWRPLGKIKLCWQESTCWQIH